MPPLRYAAARAICQPLPPILAQRIREIVYPRKQGERDNWRFTVPAQTGSLYTGTTGERCGHRFGIHGYYDWRLWAIAQVVCKPGDTIVEIGGNVGTETIGFSDIVGANGHVFTFEPFPDNVERLKAGISKARFSQNVSVMPYAMSDTLGTASFVPPSTKTSLGVGHLTDEPANDQAIEVQTVTLDSLVDEIKSAAYISMDVEGAEYRVLQGGANFIKRYRPFIATEARPNYAERSHVTLIDLHNAFVELGYRVYEIRVDGLREVDLVNLPPKVNWLCVPEDQVIKVDAIRRMIRRCLLMPMLDGLNPLRQSRVGC